MLYFNLIAQGEPLASLVERADAGLYAAKSNGRNRVICENELNSLQQRRDTVSGEAPGQAIILNAS